MPPSESSLGSARRVLVVGIGGLGTAAATALGRAGIETIGLCDFDAVEISNLPRQVLYDESDIGTAKPDAAARRLAAIAPGTSFELHRFRFGEANLEDTIAFVRRYDFLIDGTDTPASKYRLNDIAVAARRPLAHAGVTGFRGQLLEIAPGNTACLRCVFPDNSDADDGPTCSEAGVLGPLVGVFGMLQAAAALAYFTNPDRTFGNRLVLADHGRWRTLHTRRDRTCRTCGTS